PERAPARLPPDQDLRLAPCRPQPRPPRALSLHARRPLDLEGELAAALFPYLVHYKGWPVPRGLGAAEALVPPPLAPPAAWTSLAVPPPARARKRAALQAHATQYRYDADYLLSFVRANELFGDFP